jgi:hypothetical protein
MPSTYDEWIAHDITEHKGWVRGRCQGAATRMSETFSELRLVRGYCLLANGWRPQHWWCEAPDGTVIDPTAAQYTEYTDIIGYEEYDEALHGPLPIGKCMHCGCEVYNKTNRGLCSTECQVAFDEYMAREIER